jgi:hypothetical protein
LNRQFAKVGGNTPVEPGADEPRVIVKWLAKTILNERRALERARRRFVEKPSEKRLHDVRTTGRRLRSLLEDVADLAPSPLLLRRVKRAAATTDAARDATIIRCLLERSTEAAETEIAHPLLEELRHQEAIATRLARKQLRRTRFLA